MQIEQYAHIKEDRTGKNEDMPDGMTMRNPFYSVEDYAERIGYASECQEFYHAMRYIGDYIIPKKNAYPSHDHIKCDMQHSQPLPEYQCENYSGYSYCP